MGAWGTGISSNDTFADIYDEFFDLYNEGFDVKEITAKLISDKQETINEPDDCNNFWFALAKAQWECKELDQNVFEQVKQIIESGSDIEVWKSLDAQEKDLKKRQIVLDKFLDSLLTERPKAKVRKKKIIRQPPFDKGDCLTFKLSNGNYGGAVILEAIRDTEYGYCLVATTRLNQLQKPVKSDFENAQVLIANYENWDDKFNIKWYLPIRYKHINHLIEKVATIEVEYQYSMTSNIYNGMVADFDIWVIEVADRQFKFEVNNPRPTELKTIKELTKRSKWKFWKR